MCPFNHDVLAYILYIKITSAGKSIPQVLINPCRNKILQHTPTSNYHSKPDLDRVLQLVIDKMESHTFEMTENEKTFALSEPIDNTGGDYCMSLNSAIFTFGFFNVVRDSKITYIKVNPNEHTEKIVTGQILVPRGNYNINWFKTKLGLLEWLKVSVDEFMQTIFIEIITENYHLNFDPNITQLLGLPANNLIHDVLYRGLFKLNLHEQVYIHCRELSTQHNFHNGKSSDLLHVIPIKSRSKVNDVVAIYSHNPSLHYVVNGRLNELKFSIRDARGNLIDNRGKKIVLNLKIGKRMTSYFCS